jgi:lambda family phage minor tail protein L
MGQGQDKIARSLLDLEPTAIVEFFLLYFDTVDKEDSFIAFHGGSIFQKGITWQGITYLPIPVETEGFETNANGELSRPKIRVANKDYFVTDLLINNNDLQFAKLIRKRTFVKYLDDINFDGGNPWGQADASAEISKDTFVISQKTAENKTFVEFELTSPLDLENFEINNRLIMSKYCSWYYRGNGCNYKGIPLVTEDGRNLQLADVVKWDSLGEWQIGRQYLSGQATYLENKKIIINDPQNPSQKDFAKIWYVSQQDHTSSLFNKPDINESFWLRDGCNKKLDGCRRRFGLGLVEFNEQKVNRTANYFDLSFRSGNLKYNNIATNAKITGSSQSIGYEASNAIDMSTNTEWRSNFTSGAILYLRWNQPKTISQINIYDRSDTTSNFKNAYIRYYNSSNALLASGLLPNIPVNGTVISSGFSPLQVSMITISGSGSQGSAVGLREVAVFEYSPNYLTYIDQKPIPLHRNNIFQMSMMAAFQNRPNNSTEIYSIAHNIGQVDGSRFSGINLYVSGSQLMLDFATRRTGQNASIASINKTLSIPWDNDQLKPIHLICVGGLGSGISPTSATQGYIKLSNGSEESKYVLASQSGEYFHFKNPSYQSGINLSASGLKFGVNDWQFPKNSDSAGSPTGIFGQINNNIKIYSPIQITQLAFWTGDHGVDSRINQYNEVDFAYKNYDELDFNPEISTDLLGWWEMDDVDVDTGEIEAKNDAVMLKIATGEYNYSTFISSTEKKISTKNIVAVKKQNESLPFGGFPGTEKYG